MIFGDHENRMRGVVFLWISRRVDRYWRFPGTLVIDYEYPDSGGGFYMVFRGRNVPAGLMQAALLMIFRPRYEEKG